jgi:endonuclease YncB( thermonuclease family)
MRIGIAALILLLVAGAGQAEPVSPSTIVVIDGDTIKVGRTVYRLVGYDAPETRRALCVAEQRLGLRARARLSDLVATGALDLQRVACSCRPETEGTPQCNRGRLCGRLTAGGRDVGDPDR